MRRWKHNGAAAVAEEQRGVSWVASNGDDGELSLLRQLHESEGGGRREMRAHGVTGEHRGIKWHVEARRGLTGGAVGA